MKHRDLADLSGSPQKAPQRLELDAIAVEKARCWIGDLEQEVSAVETRLAMLGAFFDEPLPCALIGAMGIAANELHSQLPALKQALRDLEEK
jgi:hypothetical protein